MKARRLDTIDNQPLCKFGPGGDFTASWPGKKSLTDQHSNSLTRVLSTVAEIFGAVINPEIMTEMENDVIAEANILTKIAEQKIAGKYESTNTTDNTKTVCSASSDTTVRKEKLLFGDDCGVSKQTKRKSNHRIRTHRRTARKRTAGWQKGQGSLFEAYENSSSAA